MKKTLWLEFGFLALLIMGPLLFVGYIQTLDMHWGPIITVPAVSSNTWLLYTVLKALAAVISSQFTQKLLLLAILTLAGVGAYRLAAERPAQGKAGCYFAGIFYLFNPFVYTRFVEGQYLVLAGYALLPWAAAAMWRLITAPSWRHAWRAAAWVLAIALVNLHTIGFVLAIGLIMTLVGWRHSQKMWTWLGIGGALALVIGAIVLGPLLLGQSSAAHAIKTFDSSQYTAFATRSDVANVPVTALLLQGFWNDHSGTFVLPSSLGVGWLVVAGLLGALMIIGLINIIRRHDKLGYALVFAGLLAWWLAMGVAWAGSAPLTNWLVAHVPFYRGYREPGKWLGVLALMYSYVGSRGVMQLEDWLKAKRWLVQTVTAIALILPLAFAPTILWAAGGQLRSTNYPADWYAANTLLNADTTSFKVLVLPWHEYLHLGFVGRTVANPAASFFTKPVIVSDDPELTGVASDNPQASSGPVVNWLRGNAGTATTLQPLGVKYIILLKEADWQNYDWLSSDSQLSLVRDTTTLRLYKLEAGK